MAALDLFPARIQFVTADGRLTPEAYRAMNLLYGRVGGSTGGGGGTVTNNFYDELTVGLFGHGEASIPLPEVTQPVELPFLSDMVFSVESYGSPIQSITAGASPYAYAAPHHGSVSIQGGTVSAVTLTRQGTAVTLGLTAGIVPVATGDTVTVTYSVAPTMKFIPR